MSMIAVQKNSRRHGRTRALLAGLLTWGAVAPAGADELIQPQLSPLRLRPKAVVANAPVRLSDILIFGDADPRLFEELADKPAFDPNDAGRNTQSLVITHADVVQRLADLGVNLSRILVSGASQCQVEVQNAPEPDKSKPTKPADAKPADAGPASRSAARREARSAAAGAKALPNTKPETDGRSLANPAEPGAREPNSADAAAIDDSSLAGAVRAFVARDLAEMGGEVEVAFERSGQEFLELTSPPWEFIVHAGAGEKLGVREFTIVIRRDGRAQRTVHLAGRVRLVKPALVARRPLAVGIVLKRDDLTLEPRMFESLRDLGLDRVEPLVGQQVQRFVPAGEMLRAADASPVELVKRSRPVTIVGARAAVQLHVSGVALDSGGFGETVRVRIGDARGEKREVRGVVTGPGTVKISDGL